MVIRTFRSLLGWRSSKEQEIESTLAGSLVEKCRQNKGRISPFELLRNIPFVVFDTETTGLSVPDDDVIAIAAVVVENGIIQDLPVFDRLVNPCREVPAIAQELTGIREEMLYDQPTIYPILDDFLDFIDGSVLVAHRVGFDVGFLNKYLKKARTKIYHPTVDTITLSQVIEPFRADHSLDQLVPAYRIPPLPRHTAFGDARMTAHLFVALLQRLQELRPVKTLGELRRILDQHHL
ncbi:3'-5' exonuclease [Heliobacillus mobilis]|uniref:3'-5' exonuclease n=1 Tax=Heliobacterium mobile TaxID=28064 RepID=A0A6I3SIA7_HELMO|nr:3'-5' exonuclease [Heliobacterium mobile]MTV48611.1 3'-5' exonuclease [Heliobacterium mobile]